MSEKHCGCGHEPHPHHMCSESEYSGASLTEVGPCCCMKGVTKPHESYCICNECCEEMRRRRCLRK